MLFNKAAEKHENDLQQTMGQYRSWLYWYSCQPMAFFIVSLTLIKRVK